MRIRCRWLVAGLLAWGAVSAQAALFEDDEARRAILELRQRIDAQRQDFDKAHEDNAHSLLDLQNQIETLRAELARLQGRNEQLARDLADLQRQQKDATQSADERLRKFEPAKVNVDGREFMADPAERRDFEAALALFRKGDFAAAQPAFADFVKRYGQSSGYAPSAYFWLGNAQYATRNYRDAMQSFRALLTQAPDHLRAPEAVLSVANCQVELKDLKGARRTLEDLLKAYPQSEAAVTAKERLARLKK